MAATAATAQRRGATRSRPFAGEHSERPCTAEHMKGESQPTRGTRSQIKISSPDIEPEFHQDFLSEYKDQHHRGK